MTRRTLHFLAVAAVVTSFAYGLYRLFALRFSGGDVFPPYSSLRADPLGSRAFFEGLQLLPRPRVRRLVEPLWTLRSATNTTLLVLGADAVTFHESSDAEVADLDAVLKLGGRIVVALEPVNEEPFAARIRQPTPGTTPPKTKPGRRPPGARGLSNPHEVSLRTRWGFDVAYDKLELDDQKVAKPVIVTRTNGTPALPESLRWHTATVFTHLDDVWHPIYLRDDKPVLIERRMGAGSIVLSSDSFFISNEALRTERHPTLLAWLVGSADQVVFDEVHLGVTVDPGIATLARRYRLHGVFAALILLAGLYVWKSASPFVPAVGDSLQTAGAVAGRDASSGFVNLLRRGVPARQLLDTCFEEWRQHPPAGGPSMERKLSRIEEAHAAAVAASDPVGGYRQITQILSER
jgi:hypothetical protein